MKYFTHLLLILGVLAIPLYAQEFRKIDTIRANGVNVSLVLYQSSDNTIVEFRAVNEDASMYGIEVGVDLENMEANTALPFRGTLPGNNNAEVTLFRITRVAADRGFFFRNLSWKLRAGIAPANPDKPVVHNGTYELPWPKGKTFTVDNAFYGYGGHKDEWGYAVDFGMAEGSPVHAARAGTVTAVQAEFSQGGDDPALGDKANYVFILHSDGTTGRYLHFKHHGVTVRVGQKIRVGQRIGFSGNVGWSTGPHLHFDVVVPDAKTGMRTVPFKFRLPDGRLVEPKQGEQLSN